jgi:hypothetical protein
MCSVAQFEYTYFPNALFFRFIPQNVHKKDYAHTVFVWVEILNCCLVSGYQSLGGTLCLP